MRGLATVQGKAFFNTKDAKDAKKKRKQALVMRRAAQSSSINALRAEDRPLDLCGLRELRVKISALSPIKIFERSATPHPALRATFSRKGRRENG
jgi:hypothetical protein